MGQASGSGIFYQDTNGTASTLNVGAGNQTVAKAITDYIGSGGTNPGGGINEGRLATLLSKPGACKAGVASMSFMVDAMRLASDGSAASPVA